MTDTGRVVEEGLESPARRQGPTSPWALAVVGFALGLGIGVVVVGPPPTAAPPTTSPVAGPEEPVSTTVPAGAAGVSAEVPAFPDAVVAVARTSGSSLQHLLWPYAGSVNARPMSGADSVRFDSSGLYVALTSELSESDALVLSMGRFNQIRTVAADVTGYAWHDSRSGVLSYTSEKDGVWTLHVVKSNFTPELIAEASTPGGDVVAYGDWGWAIQSSPTEVTLLNARGEFKDVEAGVGLDSHADGWLFVMGDTPKLVSSGGGVLAIDTDLGVGRVATAVFSPDANRVAVSGERGTSVLDLSSKVSEQLGVVASPSLAWSSDSRFVLAATGAGAMVFDVDTGASSRVLADQSLLAVGVVELSAP